MRPLVVGNRIRILYKPHEGQPGKSNQSTDAYTLQTANPTSQNLAYKHTHRSPKWDMNQIFYFHIIYIAKIQNNSNINSMKLPELNMVLQYQQRDMQL